MQVFWDYVISSYRKMDISEYYPYITAVIFLQLIIILLLDNKNR